MAFPDRSGPQSMRVFVCPRCGEMLLTGARSCEYCANPLGGSDTETLADHREVCRQSSREARSLFRTAWLFLLVFALRFVPGFAEWGRTGIVALLAWVPFRVLSWHVLYGHLGSYPESPQARSWLHQALVIWGLAAIAEAILRFGLSGGW
jgi:hypothetical protein